MLLHAISNDNQRGINVKINILKHVLSVPIFWSHVTGTKYILRLKHNEDLRKKMRIHMPCLKFYRYFNIYL
jgi:hypothetical protein